MNVLFITLVQFDSLSERNIYTDLLREFAKNGHRIYAISPIEKKQHKKTYLVKEKGCRILRLQIGNTQKTNIVEKGISTVLIEPTFKKAIKEYCSKIKFDLVLYSTPPITLVNAIKYVKRRDGAQTFLLLKDIFPQNAVDMGMMSKTGVKSVLYRHFRKKEKQLYKISDHIGCMSRANVDYVIKHNPDVDIQKISICPNSIEVLDKSVDSITRESIRNKYELPIDKKIFVYGGNLGRPQGIPFIIKCLKKCNSISEVLFLIVGNGTEYSVLESYVKNERPANVKLMQSLPKEDYDTLVGACDVGMIFLDYRFTIPNFPSIMLSYMQAKLPILAVTDKVTDTGSDIVDGNFGWHVTSNNVEDVYKNILSIRKYDLTERGKNGYEFLKKYYSVDKTYDTIIRNVRKDL